MSEFLKLSSWHWE